MPWNSSQYPHHFNLIQEVFLLIPLSLQHFLLLNEIEHLELYLISTSYTIACLEIPVNDILNLLNLSVNHIGWISYSTFLIHSSILWEHIMKSVGFQPIAIIEITWIALCHIKCTKLWPVNTSLKSLGFPSIALREISFQYYSTIVYCLPFNDIKTCNQSSCILRFINSINIGSTSIWFRKFSFNSIELTAFSSS